MKALADFELLVCELEHGICPENSHLAVTG